MPHVEYFCLILYKVIEKIIFNWLNKFIDSHFVIEQYQSSLELTTVVVKVVNNIRTNSILVST